MCPPTGVPTNREPTAETVRRCYTRCPCGAVWKQEHHCRPSDRVLQRAVSWHAALQVSPSKGVPVFVNRNPFTYGGAFPARWRPDKPGNRWRGANPSVELDHVFDRGAKPVPERTELRDHLGALVGEVVDHDDPFGVPGDGHG